jgi:glucosamine--fructose-6-phosphate aminotransferase (isomerizing)
MNMTLRDEILEQPTIIKSLLEDHADGIRTLAHQLNPPDGIVIAARGTSDNAARYAKYVLGANNRIPVTLAAPSLTSVYQSPPHFNNQLVIGISQSGESPDILAVVKEAKQQGCPTLAITNQIKSPLADTAEYAIDIKAGPELSVAATKSYTAQLAVIALLSSYWADNTQLIKELLTIPSLINDVLENEKSIEKYAARYRYMDQCVVLGRGFNYATAFEWSLKLKELTYIVAQPYSSADFLHGPIALVSSGFPVLAVAPEGKVFEDLSTLIKRLKSSHQAELFIISNNQQLLNLADCPIPLPAQIPEWISPLVCIVPAQLFSYHLTLIKGIDPDNPRGLSKVTLTK